MEKPIDFANLPLYYGHMELYIVPLLQREPQYPRNNLRLPHRDTVRDSAVVSVLGSYPRGHRFESCSRY